MKRSKESLSELNKLVSNSTKDLDWLNGAKAHLLSMKESFLHDR